MVGGICDLLSDEIEFKWEIRQFSKVKIHTESILSLARYQSTGIYSNKFYTKLSSNMDNKYWILELEYSRNDTYKIIVHRKYYSQLDVMPAISLSIELFILNNEQKEEKLNDIAKRYFESKNDSYSCPIDPKYFKDEYLCNDTLTIICKLVEYGEPTTRTSPAPLEDFSENLMKDIKNLLTSEQYSDVTLIVNKTEFKVHKIILIARSPVFAAMFSHKDMEESLTHQVVMKDTNAETMKKFLEFIYSGKIEELDDESFDLWILADKYQIETLKTYCEQTIFSKVTALTVLKVLQFAYSYNIKNLLQGTLHYFSTYCKSVMKKNEWKSLSKTNPSLVIFILEGLARIAKTDSRKA